MEGPNFAVLKSPSFISKEDLIFCFVFVIPNSYHYFARYMGLLLVSLLFVCLFSQD